MQGTGSFKRVFSQGKYLTMNRIAIKELKLLNIILILSVLDIFMHILNFFKLDSFFISFGRGCQYFGLGKESYWLFCERDYIACEGLSVVLYYAYYGVFVVLSCICR